MDINQKIVTQIRIAAKGTYKKYLEKRYGVKACTGVLKDMEIEEIFEDVDLLNYLKCNKLCNINKEKLIETIS